VTPSAPTNPGGLLYPPDNRDPRKRHRWPWIVLAVVASVALGAVVVLRLSPPMPTGQGESAAPATTTVNAPASLAATITQSPNQVSVAASPAPANTIAGQQKWSPVTADATIELRFVYWNLIPDRSGRCTPKPDTALPPGTKIEIRGWRGQVTPAYTNTSPAFAETGGSCVALATLPISIDYLDVIDPSIGALICPVEFRAGQSRKECWSLDNGFRIADGVYQNDVDRSA
jgi:hypothetical protein